MTCLMIDVESTELSNKDIERLQHELVGGVILFSRNFKNKKQIKLLVSSIRKVKKNLLIAVDHEGGRVQRFREEFSMIPEMAVLGQIYNYDKNEAIKYAKSCGFLIAYELGECDIDFSFTPVLDINFGNSSIIGNRSFHQEIGPIIQLSSSLVEGLKSGGMQGIGKHFPGHGYIKEDTHLEVAIDKREFKDIQNNDMSIFKELIKKNMLGIMPSHVIYSSCDPNPAGFSKFWLKEQLRELLDFEGAIFSDDMGMSAAKIFEENIVFRVTKALEAGCDMVLVCNQGDQVDFLLEKLTWNQDHASKKRLFAMRRKISTKITNKAESHKYCIEAIKNYFKNN